ncbi:hypothetical protein BRADI_4g20660v3 [Brachypodium distachyon]|uniref:Suppressor of forked domain-containing protein n=1 Tax=Brachypodium distachyon TaxID=15368 RepID=I1IM41_BRADI|nr:hypothetical protein BRADI_4g20660v3 [Brachypodium distachyon]
MGMTVGAGETQRRRRRRRAYEFLDYVNPERGRALRWCEAARELRSADGGDMKEARKLLRSALSCVKDYASVYRTWIAMEADGGGIGAARELVFAAKGTDGEYAAFWLAYLAFELRHGGSGCEHARAVAVDAARACPRDAAVQARCATVLLQGAKKKGRDGSGTRRVAMMLASSTSVL